MRDNRSMLLKPTVSVLSTLSVIMIEYVFLILTESRNDIKSEWNGMEFVFSKSTCYKSGISIGGGAGREQSMDNICVSRLLLLFLHLTMFRISVK